MQDKPNIKPWWT